jgi:hypothetical protein
LYPVTPTSSVEGIHDKLTWEEETATAMSCEGAEGGVVSLEAKAERLPSPKKILRTKIHTDVKILLEKGALIWCNVI